jgi:hypothetical protein
LIDCAVAHVATKPARYAPFVFEKGAAPSEPFGRYVKTLKLERFLQCVWLRRVGDIARAVVSRSTGPLFADWQAFTKPERAGALHEIEVRDYAQGIL